MRFLGIWIWRLLIIFDGWRVIRAFAIDFSASFQRMGQLASGGDLSVTGVAVTISGCISCIAARRSGVDASTICNQMVPG